MNIFFSKITKLGDRQRELNFRKLPGETNEHYHVDTTDDRGKRLILSMYKDTADHWRISDQTLPAWILDAVDVLGRIIEEETNAITTTNK